MRAKIDAFESRRLAAEMQPGDDERPTRRKAAAGGARSRREAAKAARRAAAVKKNPRLADDMDSGKLSSEQADTIADAASKSDGEAALDQALIDAIAAAGVDAGRRIASEWLQRRADKDKTQSEHDRQQRRRRMSTYLDPDRGTDVIKLEGPRSKIAELTARIELRERQLWEADGGRNLEPGQHRRTREQRLFDAACDILLGHASSKTGGRPAVVININANNPDQPAEMAGVGPIPDSAVAEILARANVFVNIADRAGRNLWWGRLKRHATNNQFIALTARDKGCVQCGTHWLRCEAHHLMPWNAPGQGTTDIDNLALLCSSCHHDIHATEQTLVRDNNGTWTARPATPDEIAPKRPARDRPQRATSPLTVVERADGDKGDEAVAPRKQPTGEGADDEAA